MWHAATPRGHTCCVCDLPCCTGEVIRVLDRGTSSMRVLLESMLFSIGPALFDVIAAAALLYSKQAWIAAIVLTSVLFYVPVTVIITEYRGEMRREMNSLDNKVGSKVCAWGALVCVPPSLRPYHAAPPLPGPPSSAGCAVLHTVGDAVCR